MFDVFLVHAHPQKLVGELSFLLLYRQIKAGILAGILQTPVGPQNKSIPKHIGHISELFVWSNIQTENSRILPTAFTKSASLSA